MQKFDNPLDNIRVASPCLADWNEMFGNKRRRFCAECKLNVYNLSGMTRREAENLLLNSEGRLCVRYFTRPDGTVVTRDCPVGWRAAKHQLSRVATAVLSLIAGILTGVFGFILLNGLAGLARNERSAVANVNEIQIDKLPLADFEQFDDGRGNLGEAMVGEVYVGKPDYIYLKKLENGRLLK